MTNRMSATPQNTTKKTTINEIVEAIQGTLFYYTQGESQGAHLLKQTLQGQTREKVIKAMNKELNNIYILTGGDNTHKQYKNIFLEFSSRGLKAREALDNEHKLKQYINYLVNNIPQLQTYLLENPNNKIGRAHV